MRSWLLIPVCALALGTGFNNLRADENDKDIEIQARGAVHEAFAQPYQKDPAPNAAVDKKPPDPIPEEPAAEKPAGDNVQWIPGYWQWDGDRKDFVWISGLWRNMPAGRRWVMGYWANTPEGYRWVSGHFADAREPDNQYVPEPPANPDEGPTTSPPDDSSAYIPGSWFYGDNGYTYRTGYWTDCYADRVWIPSYYSWSPYGYRFCSGYWDYACAYRGLFFAPVYFHRPYWYNPGWYFRPYYSIGFGGLFGNFFVGFGYNHYYFGDYYARSYLNYGIYPWFWHSRHHYDPIWAHQRWVNRSNSNWATGFRSDYVARVNGTAPVPPRTLAAQMNLANSGRLPAGSPRMVNTFTEARQAGLKLETVSRQQQTTQLQSARQMVSQANKLSQSAPRVSPTMRAQSGNQTTGPGSSRMTTPGTPRIITPGTPGATTPGTPRMTTPSVPRNTTPSAPRMTTPGTPRIITPGTPGATTPGTSRMTTPSVPRNTTPSAPRIITPSAPRITTPGSPNIMTPRSSTPYVPRTTAPSTPRNTTPGAPRFTTPSTPRMTAPPSYSAPRYSAPPSNHSYAPSGRSFTPSTSRPSSGGGGGGHSSGGGGNHKR